MKLKNAVFILASSIILPIALPSCGGDPNAARLAGQTRAGEGKAQGLYNTAYANEQAGKLKAARKGYAAIGKKHPLAPVAAEATYRLAKLRERNAQPLEAFEAFDNVLKKYPASDHFAEAMKRQEVIAHQVAQGQIKNSFIGIKSRIDVSKTVKMLQQVRDNAPRNASAAKAQFTIGEVYQSRGDSKPRAMSAFSKVTSDYPDSPYAPEAQYRIGEILLSQSRSGNQDSANLTRAKNAFNDVIIRYPSHKRAADARRQIAKLSSGDLRRSYDLAEFYRKKGQTKSALFYYRETVRNSKPSPLRSQAEAWIAKLGS